MTLATEEVMPRWDNSESHSASPADLIAADTLDRAREVEKRYDKLLELGLVETTLKEVEVEGPHRLLILDETVQPGGAYKYYGAAYAAVRVAESNEELYEPNLPLNRQHPDYVREASTGSAGNWSACLAEALSRVRIPLTAFMPRGASPVKAHETSSRGARVLTGGDKVDIPIGLAERYADKVPGGKFFHPFKNPDNWAALTLMGRRLVDGLLSFEASGKLDLSNEKVKIVMQYGGGSGIGAIAVARREAIDTGLLPEDVELYAARPETEADGTPNKKYGGLAVSAIDAKAQAVLDDSRYVQGILTSSEAGTADAARLTSAVTGNDNEPSSLSGLSAILDQMEATTEPTVFVAVLTGKNVDPELRDHYMRQPGYKELAAEKTRQKLALARAAVRLEVAAFQKLSRDYSDRTVRGVAEIEINNRKKARAETTETEDARTTRLARAGRTVMSPLLSGYTAAHRAGLVTPQRFRR